MNHRRRLALLFATMIVALGVPAATASADESDLLADSGDLSEPALPNYDPGSYTAGAYIAAEQPDYSPGQIVDIGGGGWAPGETVTLIFHPEPQVRADTTMTATADEDGYFMHSEFELYDVDLGTTYTVTATGETSGQSATTTFTDAATDFYFAVGSGNWNTSSSGGATNAVWKKCLDINESVSCTQTNVAAPTSAENVVTIKNGVTVTVTAAVTVDQVVVAAGGQITVNSGITMSLANGTGTPDLSVNGTVALNGTLSLAGSTAVDVAGALSIPSAGVLTGGGGSTGTRPSFNLTSGGNLTVASGGSLTSSGSGRTNATLASGSTATVNGSMNGLNSVTANGGISVAGTLGANGGGTAITFGAVSTATVAGTGVITNVGTVAMNGAMTMDSGSTLTVSGTGRAISVGSGGVASLASTITGPLTATIDGDVTVPGGDFTMDSVSNLQVNGTLGFSGDATLTTTRGNGGPVTEVNNGGFLEFTDTANWSIDTPVTGHGDINSGAVLGLGPSATVTGAGFLQVESGADLRVGSADGITTGTGATAGNVRTSATDSYSTGANYTYDGTAAQVTGNALPATVNKLFVNNSAGVTADTARTISTELGLTSGDLSTGASLLTLATAATCSGAGDVVSTGVGGVLRGGFTIGGPAKCFGNPNNKISIDSGTVPTNITMKLVKAVPTSPAFATAVARTYSITPTGGSPDATITLHYNDGDLNGNTENALELWRVTSGAWVNQGRTGSVDIVNNAVTLSGVTQFSDWTLASTATKQDQTLTFNQPADGTYGDPDIDPGATSDSGLTVSYASNTTSVCTIVSGQIHIVGVGACSVTASQDGNDDYNAATPVTQTFDVDPAELTVTGITAEGKDYDGNTDATLDTSGASLLGVVGTEDVTLDTSGALGAFDTADVGGGKTVQISGLTLDGADKDNYSLTQPTTTADIDPAELTVTGITAEGKDYDGNTDATLDTSGASLLGVVGTEDVTLDTSGALGAFDTADVGGGKTVQISGLTLDGADKDNYSLTQPTTTADIDPAELTVTGITAEGKDYDGNTDATLDTSGASLLGVVGTEDVTLDTSGALGAFDTADVGGGKTVQISGLTLDGADKDNYSLTQPTTTADIDPAELTVTGITAEGKDYDGNTDATLDTSGASLLGVVGTEDVTLDTSGALGAFDTADVGGGKTVQISGLTLDGADKDNYSLTQPTTTADIDPAELTVTGITAEGKDYDGNTDATLDTSGASLLGVVGTEDVTLDTSGALGAFDTADVGGGKTVQISGLTLDGADKDNYSLTQPTTTADIDPAELTVTGITAEGKDYDGNTDATLDTSGASLLGVVGTEDVTLDTSGALGAFDTADVGGGKTVQISGLTLDGADKDNYSLTQPTTTADIDPVELKVDADNKSKEFNGPDPSPLTYKLSGFVNDEDKDSANVTGDADCVLDPSNSPNAANYPNVGTYPDAIICDPDDLAAPNYTFATGALGTLTVTVANTTITYSGDTTEQYSDKAHLKATLTSGGNPLAGMTVTFRLGSQDFVQDTTDANGVAELDLKVDQAPATTFVVARFAGTTNYTQSSTGNQTFVVTPEDARATYTGFWDVATSSPSSSTAIVTLSATIQDITDVLPGSDAEAGDIRKAKVDFINRDNNAVLCNDLPVGLVTPGNTKVGTATCNWYANIGSADATAYTIGIRVEGWYTRNDSTENAVVNVYKPLTTAFITGGGFLANQTTAGAYGGDQTKKTNYGFNVKYNKSGTNLQGSINAIIRKGAYTYQVKGNAMTSLTSKLTSSPKTATFAGKANIQNITNPLQAQAIDGNATLQVTMSDYGTPGTGSDKIGITVLNKSGGLWFASAWSGTKTLEQLLSGGNLTVR